MDATVGHQMAPQAIAGHRPPEPMEQQLGQQSQSPASPAQIPQTTTTSLAARTSLNRFSTGARRSRSGSRSRSMSIGSIQEDLTDVPQSFLDKGYKSPASPTRRAAQTPDPIPDRSLSPNFYCPSGAFQGWKQVRLAGKEQSKSSTDLRLMTSLRDEWVWDLEQEPKTAVMEAPVCAPRALSLEDMPFEILDMILSCLMQDIDPDSYGPRNRDLVSCLMTSRMLHAATLSVLYKHVTIPFSITFSKMLNHIGQYPGLGTLVRRLDFSHYSSVGFGRTRRDNNDIQNLTPTTLVRCLDLFTNLKEFLAHEHIDDELDEDVLLKLFSKPSVHAIDFCASSSRKFVSGFTTVVSAPDKLSAFIPNLRRLGLHACTTLQAPVFEALLPRLTNLTHLDVGRTLITDKALLSIPQSARLTHLGLGKCHRLTGSKVVEFLTTHKAVKTTLIFLNLMADASRYQLLSDDDLFELLPHLPATLRALNIGGAQINSKHVSLLLPLTKHLEELGLSNADLSVHDLNSFFVPKPPPDTNSADVSDEELTWEPCALRYMDLTAVPPVKQVTLFSNDCHLITPHSYPLEVIELSDPVVQQLKDRSKSTQRIGWVVKELGRRGWFVRLPSGEHPEDGRRSWKMGARWWGMRKVPVATQEVGGMYGHYMFKS